MAPSCLLSSTLGVRDTYPPTAYRWGRGLRRSVETSGMSVGVAARRKRGGELQISGGADGRQCFGVSGLQGRRWYRQNRNSRSADWFGLLLEHLVVVVLDWDRLRVAGLRLDLN